MQITRLPGTGTLPPLSPVPAPRVTMGTPCWTADFTQAATSAVLRGKTTAAGIWRSSAVPSKL